MKRKTRFFTLPFFLILIFYFPVLSQFPVSDDELKNRIKDAGSSKDYPDDNVLIVLENVDVDVEDSGLSHVNNQVIVKILNEKGAAEYPCLRFDYDPASNFIEVKKVRLFRKDKDPQDIDLTSLIDMKQPEEMIYWGRRMKLLPLPRLNPDDVIVMVTYKKGYEIAYLKDDQKMDDEESKYFPPMRGHFYDVILFENKYPIKEKKYTLHVSKEKPVQFEVYNGEVKNSFTFEGKNKYRYSFWKENVPAYKEEYRSVEVTDFATKVVLATVSDWQEKSRWFFTVNDPVFKYNNSIESKVAEIIKGLKTNEEKYLALQHWVAQEIRYSGVTMGKGEGYTIHPGIMTYNDRCGVCKDIAGMLITMLRAAGFETYPAMTMAGARVEKIPADQFNHCVVAVKEKDNKYTMLDPTWAPFSTQFWSHAEGEQNYVIGTPWGEDLTITPLFTADMNKMNITSTSDIQKDGSTTGEIKFTATGYMDSRLRNSFSYTLFCDVKAMFQRILESISEDTKLTDYKYSDYYDFSKNMEITIKYSIKDYALISDEYLFFIPPIARLTLNDWQFTSLFYAATLKERKYDSLLWFTQDMTLDEKITFPKNYEINFKPEDKKIESEAALFEYKTSNKNNILTVKERFTSKKRTLPAKQYKNFKEAVDAFKDYAEKEVVLKTKTEKKDDKK
ncbi:DUF3857 and transglutaminase domain-containing protein [bacterium]|nr:DUF3857 and transglutaminase domain-containing protein [bacterium]